MGGCDLFRQYVPGQEKELRRVHEPFTEDSHHLFTFAALIRREESGDRRKSAFLQVLTGSPPGFPGGKSIPEGVFSVMASIKSS